MRRENMWKNVMVSCSVGQGEKYNLNARTELEAASFIFHEINFSITLIEKAAEELTNAG